MKWISVKDRLPEANINVLVFCELGVFIGEFFDDYWWILTDWDVTEYQKDFEPVTHWMLLPEEPKE